MADNMLWKSSDIESLDYGTVTTDKQYTCWAVYS